MKQSLFVSLLLGFSAAEIDEKAQKLGEKLHKMHENDPHVIDANFVYK